MEKIENSRAWECNQAHVVQEFIGCAIDRRPGRQAGRQMSADARQRGEVAKLQSCEAARTGGRTECAGGRDGEVRKRPRKEPWRRPRAVYHTQEPWRRPREGVHVQCTTVSDPERPVHRGRFRPFPRVKSRRSLCTFRTNYCRGWGFFGFFLILLLFIYFVM